MVEDSIPTRPSSVHEQGVFLYDSDDSEDMDATDSTDDMDDMDDTDEMDETDEMDVMDEMNEIDEVVEGGPIDLEFAQPSPLFPTSYFPVLPPISAVVNSQTQYPGLHFNYQLPPVIPSVPRLPSPSDMALPLSHRHHGSEDDGAMAAENLGHKWGKPDFFEAREHNKITISRLTEPKPSAIDILVPDAITKTNSDTTEGDGLRGEPKDPEEHVASPETEAGNSIVSEPAQEISTAAESEQNTILLVHEHAPESPCVSNLTHEPCLLGSDVEFLKPSSHETPAMDQATTNVTEALDWTPASAYELHQYKQQNQIRKEQETEACDNPMDQSVVIHSPVILPKDGANGKRKANEISETTEEELVWQGNGDSNPPVSSSSPVTPEPEMSLASPPTTPQDKDSADARPSKKIRKIAERVGYAALGGATVGAMVFTSLIYTAPSFA